MRNILYKIIEASKERVGPKLTFIYTSGLWVYYNIYSFVHSFIYNYNRYTENILMI